MSSLPLAEAKNIAQVPHILKITASNGGSGQAKLSSALVSIPNHNTKLKDLDLAGAMEARLQSAPQFGMNDLMPNHEQRESILHQSMIIIVKSLIDHHPEFKHLANNPLLQYKPRRPLPLHFRNQHISVHSVVGKHTTALYTSLINETYTKQLGLDAKMFENSLIPSVNSSAINQAIRKAQIALRRAPQPLTPEQKLITSLQLGPGLLDIMKTFVKASLDNHVGRPDIPGSWSSTFSILNKAHLASGDPKDYHSLLTTLETMMKASFLDCWRTNCGFPSIEAFAASNPTPSALLAIARKIAINHAKRIVPHDRNNPDDAQYASEYDTEECAASDTVFYNGRLGLTTLLRIFILKYAIDDGDIGRAEDIFGVISIALTGGGKDAWAEELFHYIHGVKCLWPEPFADIMRDSLIINIFREGSNAQAADVSKEYLSAYAKYFISAESVEDAVGIVDAFDAWMNRDQPQGCVVQ
ncbi:hypothetical protein BDZ89DRAFT_1063279 [Hymenopellis radicata]|nr:hypothetical protein BDZ89DRAFT_1063279 [Hymenopellis radicata]